MVELSERVALELAEYLATHKLQPSRGMGVVREVFQEHPPMAAPALEPLLRHGTSWYIRWPNGSVKWVTESFLRQRGFSVPMTPLVADVK